MSSLWACADAVRRGSTTSGGHGVAPAPPAWLTSTTTWSTGGVGGAATVADGAGGGAATVVVVGLAGGMSAMPVGGGLRRELLAADDPPPPSCADSPAVDPSAPALSRAPCGLPPALSTGSASRGGTARPGAAPPPPRRPDRGSSPKCRTQPQVSWCMMRVLRTALPGGRSLPASPPGVVTSPVAGLSRGATIW